MEVLLDSKGSIFTIPYVVTEEHSYTLSGKVVRYFPRFFLLDSASINESFNLEQMGIQDDLFRSHRNVAEDGELPLIGPGIFEHDIVDGEVIIRWYDRTGEDIPVELACRHGSREGWRMFSMKWVILACHGKQSKVSW